MPNRKETDLISVEKRSTGLFEGERVLVITGMVGFVLAFCIAIFIYFQGSVILPHGNIADAFSFNAAIGIFTLSIAAILPLANFGVRKRRQIRWLFIVAVLYAYSVETIQNFRGLNPRFSDEGTILDNVAGILFAIDSMLLVVLSLVLMIRFFRMKKPLVRPILIIGIRYAFLSVLIANLAGVWMILLQGRFTGDAGNLIVLHGMGFHSLQALIFPAWILDRVTLLNKSNLSLIHYGSLAWLLSLILMSIHTAMGRTVFEPTLLPIIIVILLLFWLGTVLVGFRNFIKGKPKTTKQTNQISLQKEGK